jgi:hypothetical protein
MKTSILLLVINCAFLVSGTLIAQSISYDPGNGIETIKNGIVLDHTDGTIRLGVFSSSLQTYIQTHSNHPLYFGTNNSTPKVVLGLNGNLGINLPDGIMPTEKLEIKNGSIGFSGWESNIKPNGIVFTDDAGLNSKAFFGYSTGIFNGLAFKSLTTNLEEIRFMEISSQPRISLGDVSDNQTLNINGDMRFNSLGGSTRSLVLTNTSSVLIKSNTSPTQSISPFSFTFSDQGNLANANVGFYPSFSQSVWIPYGSYHFVEKALLLPEGSTIKNITAYLTDNDVNNRMSMCLQIINSSTGASNSYCLVTNTNSPNNLPYSFQNDLNIIVENQAYSYVLRVEPLSNTSSSGVWNSSMGFGAIKVSMGY